MLYNQTSIVCPRYVSIKPDNRKLANGTNVLGLLIDTLLMEGFHLVSTRTSSSEDKTECYSFERIKRPEVLTMNKTLKPETTLSEQSQKKKWGPLFSFTVKRNCHFLFWKFHIYGMYVSQICTQCNSCPCFLACHLRQPYFTSAYATLTASCSLNTTVHLVCWHMLLLPSMPLSFSFLENLHNSQEWALESDCLISNPNLISY